MKAVITVIVVLIFIGNSNGYFHRHNESVFIRDDIKTYCDMKCGSEPHTLCEDKNLPKCTDNFFIYEHIKQDLRLALNGLRDRIAYKMQVSNMVRLAWDDELADMAESFLKRCTPLEPNKCTDLGSVDETTQDTEPRYYHVSGTSGFRRSQFKPYDLVSSIVRDWYYGKNFLQPPIIDETDYGDNYGILLGHNNFTHLANPRLTRVGCGLAKFGDGYGLVCYYFPYFRSNVTFFQGPPGTNCPHRFPLKELQFENLCTEQGVQWGLNNTLLIICMGASLLVVYLRVQDVPAPRARGSDLLAKVELVMPEPQ